MSTKRNCIILFAVVLVAIAPAAVNAEGEPPNPEPNASTIAHVDRSALKSFLQSLRIVRIGLSESSAAGHHMTAFSFIQKLRSLDFSGKIQVIYDRNNEDNLETLLPGYFKSKGDPQVLPGQVEVISHEYFAAHPDIYKKVELAIMGAEDTLHGDHGVRRRTKPDHFNAQILLRLQPPNWTQGRETLETARDADDLQYLDHLNSMRYFPNLTFGAPMGWNLTLFDTLKNSTRLKSLPFYNARVTAPRRLFNLALGLAELKSDPSKGDIVVPVLGAFNSQQIANFRELLQSNSETKDFVIIDDAYEFFKTKLSGVNFLFFKAPDPQISALFLKRSFYPPAISGDYNENLMLSYGRPFMPVEASAAKEEISFSDEARSLFEGAHQALMSDESLKAPDQQSQAGKNIAAFINAALDDSHGVRKSFSEAAKIFRYDQLDKFEAGLAHAMLMHHQIYSCEGKLRAE